MNEPDLSELMQEVKALRLIVYSLVEQNQAMKAEFNDFKQEIQSKSSLDSNSLRHIESDSSTDSTSDRTIEQNSPTDSISGKAIVQNNSTDSICLEIIEQDNSIDSTSERTIAQSNSIDSTSDSAIASDRATDSNLSLTSGMNERQEIDTLLPISTDDAILPLPSKLSLSNSNIYPLAGHLRLAGFGGGKESPVEAAAKLFLHFYNEESGEYTHLRKLTGYSEGGLAKLLMRLRANGYLIKTGFQQHAITGKALYLMQQAGCK